MRRLVETYETLGGDVWRRMRRLVKRIRIHMCDWKKQVPWGLVFSRSGKTSPLGTCFFQKWKKQVPRGLVFGSSGKNKSPGDLFFQVWKKQDFT